MISVIGNLKVEARVHTDTNRAACQLKGLTCAKALFVWYGLVSGIELNERGLLLLSGVRRKQFDYPRFGSPCSNFWQGVSVFECELLRRA